MTEKGIAFKITRTTIERGKYVAIPQGVVLEKPQLIITEEGQYLVVPQGKVLEPQSTRKDPYFGKGRSFGFVGTFGCPWILFEPMKPNGDSNKEEPYTGKIK